MHKSIIILGNYSGFVFSPISPHPNPSPKVGEGLKYDPIPLLPTWEKGLGDEGKLSLSSYYISRDYPHLKVLIDIDP
jgi:hypothetical protein